MNGLRFVLDHVHRLDVQLFRNLVCHRAHRSSLHGGRQLHVDGAEGLAHLDVRLRSRCPPQVTTLGSPRPDKC